MAGLIAVVLVLPLLAAAVVTGLKAKWGTLLVGFLVGIAWIVGAIRLARPDSWWARRFYDEPKRDQARRVAPGRRKLAIPVLVATVVLAACALAFLKTYRIPSSAMEPVLRCQRGSPGCSGEHSDRILVVRYLVNKEPGRGDIVVFEPPEEARTRCGAGGTYVKRVIGLPGEQWELRNGVVFVDGAALREPYLDDDRRDNDTRPPRRIPDDSYVVLGDNRTQSCDSRVWGTLPSANLIGRVVLRYWPPDRVGAP